MKIFQGEIMKLSGILAFMGILLTGCADKIPIMTPEIQSQLITQVKSGDAVLDCEAACYWAWIHKGHDDLAVLNAAENWEGLATRTLQIGRQIDLGYFYLGRAAEGLGADEAALKYYRIAGALTTDSNGSRQCAESGNTCNGISLPQDIYPRLAALRADMERKELALHPAPVMPVTKKHKAPAPAPKAEADNSWITPPPITR